LSAEPVHTDVVLITGMSGSGKSVALAALEDAGYFCVDNLPPELLESFLLLECRQSVSKIAIAMDVRSASSLHLLPQFLDHFRRPHLSVRVVFLDASSDTLVRRFSETRRRHPLSLFDANDPHGAITQAIEQERDLLSSLRERAQVIDTSMMRSAQLQTVLKGLLGSAQQQVSLSFQSFAFKRGVPLDANFVFDVRMLPNPYYETELRALNGRDAAVAQYLFKHEAVGQMIDSIEAFLRQWLPELIKEHRSYVNVAIGCTGGQHRSVHVVEQLVARFESQYPLVKRHRELDQT
jgi:RNase adapter protein RapZ